MQNTVTQLTFLIRALAAHTNRSASTVSRLVTGSGDTIRRIEKLTPNGTPAHRISTERAERAFVRIAEIWPSDLEWPRTIPRPTPNKEAA